MTTQIEIVDRIFERLFGARPDAAALRDMLTSVGEPPNPRLQLGVLKLSEGDVEKLKQNIELARIDYRDVLAYAEYPEQMRSGASNWNMATRELDEIRHRDRAQYEAWLASCT